MASWSYAFRRIRILFAVIVDIRPIAQMGRRPGLGAPPRSYPTISLRLLCSASEAYGVQCDPAFSPAARRAALEGGPSSLLEDLADDPRANGAPALADREPKALVH